MRKHALATPIVILTLALASCADKGDSTKDGPTPATLTITCQNSAGDEKAVPSLEEAWKLSEDQRSHCTAAFSDDFEISTEDEAALAALDEDAEDLDSLASLYSYCATHNLDYDADKHEGITGEFFSAYASLCPDQPELDSVQAAYISNQAKAAREEAAAKRKEAEREARIEAELEAQRKKEAQARAKTYTTVEELLKAYKKAGGECEGFVRNDAVALAKESGKCNDGETILSIFDHGGLRDIQIETTEDLLDETGGARVRNIQWLIGKNWIINTEDPYMVEDELGGDIITLGEERD